MSRQLIQSCIDAGLRAHHEGNIDAARKAYERALALAPDDANAQQLLGVALLQLGEPRQAVVHLERAARKLKNNAGVQGNLAQAYFSVGLYEKSHDAFRRAMRLDPAATQYQLGSANSLALQGRLGEAESLLRRMSERYPTDPYVWFNLGNTLRDQRKAEPALAAYRHAISFAPDLVDARNNMAGVLHGLLLFKEAEQEYRACLAQAPGHALAHCNLVSVLIDLGRFEEAEVECRRILRAQPDFSLAHTFLGSALGHQGKLEEALASHAAAVAAAPDDLTAIEAYAGALADLAYVDESSRWLSRALALKPDSNLSQRMLSTLLLANGYFQEGWARYESRPARVRFVEKYPDLDLARTLPADLGGKKICVLREQGLGDEIFFLRFAPALHAAGAHVSYRASNKIGSILGRVSCIGTVLEETAPVPPAHAVIMAGDLPHALHAYPASALPTIDATRIGLRLPRSPRATAVYWPPVPPPLALEALTPQLDRVRARLARAGPGPYLGVTWQGGTVPEKQTGASWVLYKQIGLTQLAAAIEGFPGTFVALQRNPEPGEIETLAAALGRPVHDFTDLNEDLEGMLALLALADEYVGVSNTNIHLRAGVGRTARVLVPRPPEWRWMARGRVSPWFPDFTIYRQGERGDWNAAMAELKQDLAARWADQ